MVSAFAVLTLSLVTTGGTPASAQGPFLVGTVAGNFAYPGVSSLVLNGDDVPVVAYMEGIWAGLYVVTCFNRSCDGGSKRTVDSTTAGGYPSMELNGLGHPVIAYYDEANKDLKLAVCQDAGCTASTVLQSVDTEGDVGEFASLELTADGLPVISYRDATNLRLKVARCAVVDCSSGTQFSTVSGTGVEMGKYSSLALSGTTLAVSYYDGDTDLGSLYVVGCQLPDGTCGSPSSITEVAGMSSSSVALRGDLPVIGYTDDAGLHLATCADASCSTASISHPDPDPAREASLVLNGSGFPVISYFDGTFQDLALMVCRDKTCGSSTLPFGTRTIVAQSPSSGRFSSIDLDDQGNPVISYSASGNTGAINLASVPRGFGYIDAFAGRSVDDPPTPGEPDAAGTMPAAADATLGWPTSMAFDAAGNMYFTDRYNHTVRVVSTDGATVTTIAGMPGESCTITTDPCGDGEAADAAHLRSPWGIAVDTAVPANVYVSDYGAHKVRRIDGASGIITTVAGTGVAGDTGDDVATASQLKYPSGLVIDGAGNLLIADRGNHRIRKVDSMGTVSTFLGARGAPGSTASCATAGTVRSVCNLYEPTDIEVRGSSTNPSVSSTTDFFIADRGTNTVLVTRDGSSEGSGIIADYIGTGAAGHADGPATVAQFNQPLSVAYDALHEELYIADSRNMRVRRFSFVSLEVTTVAGDGTGKLGTGAYVPPTDGGGDLAIGSALNFPIGVAFRPTGDESQGTAYVSAVYENRIRRLDISPNLPG